ncbi:family 20 glycosylhydrolase [Arenibacter sp. 6A1]|uniref:beta-N-acetylhexosaminidase n=1 Tax=Arenibacter sp. 6A1 TaxID=2720391 RepID=UPI0014460E87|nr:family 20 glycosylhydrolase [Arenibacter sp. 6A1]NKI27505.1 family 20 glycosylhydrolase [Arenibacter sp. 6A1]
MNKLILAVLSVFFLVFSGCVKENDIEDFNIIPKPQELKAGTGGFELNENTSLFIGGFNELEKHFIEEIKKETGFQLKLVDKEQNNCIQIQSVENLSEEEYQLIVAKKGIIIRSSSPAGAYYALQTVKQLISLKSKKNNKYVIPAVKISDKPAFAWRGYMLDESRHFFGKDKIKEALDFMAELKLNRFHWHLTDDQGWRIEIKKYPKLTEIGAWRVDYTNRDETLNDWWGRPVQKEGEKATYGGYYTQEDIREIIAYAKERYIEILPEIDVPGHSLEILAAYPELACEPDRKYYVGTGGVLKDNALCASNPYTYEFLEDILGEVMDLFPLNYMHIGGDECNKSGWKNHQQCQAFIKEKGLKEEQELQSFFIKQVEKMVNAKGKNMIGWNEILEGGLAPNATVMSWQGEEGGIIAAKAGHNVIMTPMEYNYLDLKQGQSESEPNLGYSEALLSTCYNYKVVPEGLTQDEAQRIMGIQGNLWTESISDWGKVTYMTFPRLFAVAENGWSPESNQNFDDFINRLKPQLKRLDAKGIRYAKSVFNPWIYQKGNGNSIEITLDSELNSPEIRYTLDGSEPTEKSRLYGAPFTLKETKTIKSAIFKNGERLGDVIENTFPIHKAAGAKVVYNHPFSKYDEAAKEQALTDLNYGQVEVDGDNNWQGFYDDFDITIELDHPTDIEEVVVNSLRLTIFGIYPPLQLEVFGSTDGKVFRKIGETDQYDIALVQGRNRIVSKIPCAATGLTKIQVKAKLLNQIPKGHHKAGDKAYLKIDEVLVL